MWEQKGERVVGDEIQEFRRTLVLRNVHDNLEHLLI